MAGPWEKYQTPAESGPWAKYEPKKEAAPEPAAKPEQGGWMDVPIPGVGFSTRQIRDGAAGAVRGAGSIGATIMAPVDVASGLLDGKGLTLESNRERRKAMTDSLRLMGADTESFAFQGGKLGGEIAGTAGAGGATANVLSKVPGLSAAVPGFLNALRTGGMATGQQAAPGVLNAARDLGIRAVGGALSGGLQAGLVDPEQASTGAAVGGAMPIVTKTAGLVGSGAGAAVRRALPKASPEVATLAGRAKVLGIDIPADRLVDSRPLNALASSLNYVPLSGRAAVEDKMMGQFNRAVSRTIGQDSENMAQALRSAAKDLGSKFDDVLTKNTVKVDEQFVNELAEAANKAAKELGSDGASIIGKQVDDIIAKAAQGEIDGQAAYNIKKTLDRIGSRATPEAYYARDLKKALMGALNRSLGPDEARAFARVRQQYGNMLDLEGLVPNGAEGGLSVGKLANMKSIGNPEVQELADIAGQFLKSRESPHGAAQRVVLGGVASVAAGLGAAPYVAAGVGAGRATNAFLKSPRIANAMLGAPNAPLNLLSKPVAELGYQAAPVFIATNPGR